MECRAGGQGRGLADLWRDDPAGYRQWELVAPAQEAEPLNELRAVLGNAVAIKAYRDGTLPFPDGAVLAKLAWKHVQSPEFAPASVPGAATTVQIMVKDSRKIRDYRRLGLWPLRQRQGRERGAASNLLCLPRSQRERARLRLHALGPMTIEINPRRNAS